MDRKTLNRLGLAATILLVPGGFLLGATLAAQHYRKQKAEGDETAEPADDTPSTPDAPASHDK